MAADKFSMPDVELFVMATGKEDGRCYFESGNSGIDAMGRVSNEGDYLVDVCALDSILKDRKVTFVKMDIEGAELDTLMGAKDIICKQKPTLAISIYHSDEDMIRIAEYIKAIVPEYRLYCRHYSFGFNDTVLYAVI